jgi:hypothetical protein
VPVGGRGLRVLAVVAVGAVSVLWPPSPVDLERCDVDMTTDQCQSLPGCLKLFLAPLVSRAAVTLRVAQPKPSSALL